MKMSIKILALMLLSAFCSAYATDSAEAEVVAEQEAAQEPKQEVQAEQPAAERTVSVEHEDESDELETFLKELSAEFDQSE